MKTQDEIVARIKERQKEDLLGFETGVLVACLDFLYAKQFLEESVTESEWEQETKTPTEIIIDYMPFAWEKANNCRGISANRSIGHFISWLWLDGKSDWLEKECENHYEYYGKPQLVRICEEYGIDWRKLDDDRWVNSEGEEPLSASQALNLYEDVEMKSTPTLMQDWGIRATLEGTKLQTRRANGLEKINQNPDDWELTYLRTNGNAVFRNRVTQQDVTIKCPYGGYGDELWFRGTWRTRSAFDNFMPSQIPMWAPIEYKASPLVPPLGGKWRSPLFMCRWMFRLSRTITRLRCERLCDITGGDAIAEGIALHPMAQQYPDYHPRLLYYDIWDSINGKKLPVSKNCWLWVLEWENKK